jgi:hypothetical protein
MSACESSTDATSINVKLGEAYVHLGNLTDTDAEENDESMGWYRKAVVAFRLVLANDETALPEQFVEFLADWETDMVEGGETEGNVGI